MKPTRSLYPRMILTLLALLGVLDSLYLSLSRIQQGDIVCPAFGGCETVQASAWSTLPPGNGLPVAFLGVGGYAIFLLLGLVALQKDTIGSIVLPVLILIIASLGLLFSAYLVIIQIVIIKAICFWCLVSAGLELGVWITAFLDWRAWRATTLHVVHAASFEA